MAQLKILLGALTILLTGLCPNLAHAQTCEMLFSESRSQTLKREAREAFASNLKILSRDEIKARIWNHSIAELVGFSRDANGILQPQFTSQAFKSIRENLPEGIMGGTGWYPQRETRIIGLEPTSFQNHEAHINELASALPSELRSLFQHQSLVTSSYSSSDYSLLMIAAPETGGGQTGLLLHNSLPIIIKDDKSGQEFVIEMKGAGAINGGYHKDKVESVGGGAVRGGDWTIIGGLVENQGEREVSQTNQYAFGILKDPKNATLSMGHLAFTTPIGRQALILRLSPGNIRTSYVINYEKPSSQKTAKWVTAISRHLLRTQLAGYVALTHPENFIGSKSDDRVFMTDFADFLPAQRFPVRWGFSSRSFSNVSQVSLLAAKQVLGYSEVQNLKDIKTGYLEAFAEAGFALDGLRQEIEEAKSFNDLVTLIFEKVILKIQVEKELKFGRLPETLLSAQQFLNETYFPTRAETVNQAILSYFRSHTSIVSANFGRCFNELHAYPKSARADSFSYHMTHLREGVLIPIVEKALATGRLKPHELYSAQLEIFFESYLVEQRAKNGSFDLVWSKVELSLGDNKYASDLMSALKTSAKEAAAIIRTAVSPYFPQASSLQKSAILALKDEIQYFEKISGLTKSAEESLAIAKARLIKLENMSPQDFASQYLSDVQNYLNLILLPYHRASILAKSHPEFATLLKPFSEP